MADEQMQILVTDPEAWAERKTPCVERGGPLGPMWVHAYTLAEFAKIKQLACAMCGRRVDEKPTADAMLVAQVVWVCRDAPDSERRVFRVEAEQEREAFQALRANLFGPWVETVCAESDSLCMGGYVPRKSGGKPGQEAAKRNLREALADPAVWAAFDVLSLKLYGVPATDNGQPLASALTAFEANLEAQEQLVGAMGALTGV